MSSLNKDLKKDSEDFIRPSYYKGYSVEVIDMMVSVYGSDAVASFCEINAFKYRMRVGSKPGQSIEDDLKKEKWYLNKAKSLLEK